jgi:hypothetical protein
MMPIFYAASFLPGASTAPGFFHPFRFPLPSARLQCSVGHPPLAHVFAHGTTAANTFGYMLMSIMMRAAFGSAMKSQVTQNQSAQYQHEYPRVMGGMRI